MTKTDVRCPHCHRDCLGQTTLELQSCKTLAEVQHRPVFLEGDS